MKIRVVSNNIENTFKLGKIFSGILKRGDVIVVNGPLGAGKTTFIKGIVKGLGGDPDKAVSPTFTIIKEYKCKKFRLFHLDFYRIDHTEEITNLGYEEYFYSPDGITIIEWGEKIIDFLNICFIIDILYRTLNKRLLIFSYKA